MELPLEGPEEDFLLALEQRIPAEAAAEAESEDQLNEWEPWTPPVGVPPGERRVSFEEDRNRLQRRAEVARSLMRLASEAASSPVAVDGASALDGGLQELRASMEADLATHPELSPFMQTLFPQSTPSPSSSSRGIFEELQEQLMVMQGVTEEYDSLNLDDGPDPSTHSSESILQEVSKSASQVEATLRSIEAAAAETDHLMQGRRPVVSYDTTSSMARDFKSFKRAVRGSPPRGLPPSALSDMRCWAVNYLDDELLKLKESLTATQLSALQKPHLRRLDRHQERARSELCALASQPPRRRDRSLEADYRGRLHALRRRFQTLSCERAAQGPGSSEWSRYVANQEAFFHGCSRQARALLRQVRHGVDGNDDEEETLPVYTTVLSIFGKLEWVISEVEGDLRRGAWLRTETRIVREKAREFQLLARSVAATA